MNNYCECGINLDKKAYIACTGCPESRIDASRVKNFLVENEWMISNGIEDADLILFRACGLTNNQINNSKQFIENLKRNKKRGAKLIVWGCLPKINREALRSVYSEYSGALLQ